MAKLGSFAPVLPAVAGGQIGVLRRALPTEDKGGKGGSWKKSRVAARRGQGRSRGFSSVGGPAWNFGYVRSRAGPILLTILSRSSVARASPWFHRPAAGGRDRGGPDFDRRPPSVLPPGPDWLKADRFDGDPGWELPRPVAVATGAFPVAFPTQLLSRGGIDGYTALIRRLVLDAPHQAGGPARIGRRPVPPIFPQNLPPQYPFDAVDGGLVTNEPVDLARRVLGPRWPPRRRPVPPVSGERCPTASGSLPPAVGVGHDKTPAEHCLSRRHSRARAPLPRLQPFRGPRTGCCGPRSSP